MESSCDSFEVQISGQPARQLVCLDAKAINQLLEKEIERDRAADLSLWLPITRQDANFCMMSAEITTTLISGPTVGFRSSQRADERRDGPAIEYRTRLNAT